MKSAIVKNGAAEGLPATEICKDLPGARSDAMAVCVEFCDFLQDGLADAQRVLGNTLVVQQAMMDVISRHVLRLSGGRQPILEPDDMLEIITALQSDDLMRQRHENLARALAVMLEAAQDARTLAETVQEQRISATALRHRWTADLMEALTLDEIRQEFGQNLKTADGD